MARLKKFLDRLENIIMPTQRYNYALIESTNNLGKRSLELLQILTDLTEPTEENDQAFPGAVRDLIVRIVLQITSTSSTKFTYKPDFASTVQPNVINLLGRTLIILAKESGSYYDLAVNDGTIEGFAATVEQKLSQPLLTS